MPHGQSSIFRAGQHLLVYLFYRYSSVSTICFSPRTFMYSNNGTTFHGADRELSNAHAKAIRDPNFRNRFATDGTAWHFLPSSSSHFGGLWEAGVKNVKQYLNRCIGLHTLTFEEMSTHLCRIEACLHSRLIASVFDNFDDYHALTSVIFNWNLSYCFRQTKRV